MKKQKQLSFFKENPKHFGGSLLKGNAKTKRPLSTKQPIHLVLKSAQAMGNRSMLQSYYAKRIDGIVRKLAKECDVSIYHFVNVGNHLHLVIRLKDLKAFHKFIRSITGLIARIILKAERGSAKNLKFWVARPFTRLVSWGKDWEHLKKYMLKNIHQANKRELFIPWGFEIIDLTMIASLNTE